MQRALAADGPPLDEITPPRDSTSHGIAYLGALLLYLAILTYGFFIAIGIVTEKATRVVEVILSAVRPVELLSGKVVGLGLLSLVQFSLVAVVAFGTALVTGVDLPAGAPLAILLVVVFSLLGYLLYACAFAVAGSVVSRQEDLQGSSAPLTVMLVAGFILTQTALDEPDGTLATGALDRPADRAARDALARGADRRAGVGDRAGRGAHARLRPCSCCAPRPASTRRPCCARASASRCARRSACGARTRAESLGLQRFRLGMDGHTGGSPCVVRYDATVPHERRHRGRPAAYP